MSDQALSHLKRFVQALQEHRRDQANEAAAALIALAAPLGEKWRLIAKVMQTNGELKAANRAMELYAEAAGSPLARYEQAALAAQTGRLEEARRIMRDVPPDVPAPAAHAYFLGTMALNMGELDVAERHLLAALDSDPALGQAMLALASIRERTEDDPVGRRILAAGPAMKAAPALERAQYHYAAGRIHFDQEAADPAFEEFTRGGELAARERPYDALADRANAARSREGFDRALIDRVGTAVSIDTSDAIFVTGLPRSGTTLVEQILASHSAVIGGEELGRMAIVRRDLPEAAADGLRAHLGSGTIERLAEIYLRLSRERFGARGRFIDKGLGNTRYIGMIAALLPGSPIIWLRRDPLDCALSAFRTYFVQGLEWSWKLEDIAAHFRLEDELFAFWSQMLPDRILTVEYADLVRDPKAQIERILGHCGLPTEPQVFEPHKTDRIVSTASVTQVRAPINRKGLGSAEPYRQHLTPFLQAYGA